MILAAALRSLHVLWCVRVVTGFTGASPGQPSHLAVAPAEVPVLD
jgi:hypothetical protein